MAHAYGLSCALVNILVNRKLEGEQHHESEYFGYRLRNGVLEI
ncbi:hypothetical protein [Candidatus Williamhamiltonella defendens]|nr:hypothetical protein [Candidatus Hamiltonella defensa]